MSFAEQNAAAAKQQKHVVHEIGTNIHEISRVSQDNLDIMDQLEAAAHELQKSAQLARGLRKTFG